MPQQHIVEVFEKWRLFLNAQQQFKKMIKELTEPRESTGCKIFDLLDEIVLSDQENGFYAELPEDTILYRARALETDDFKASKGLAVHSCDDVFLGFQQQRSYSHRV